MLILKDKSLYNFTFRNLQIIFSCVSLSLYFFPLFLSTLQLSNNNNNNSNKGIHIKVVKNAKS